MLVATAIEKGRQIFQQFAMVGGVLAFRRCFNFFAMVSTGRRSTSVVRLDVVPGRAPLLYK